MEGLYVTLTLSHRDAEIPFVKGQYSIARITGPSA